MSCLSQENRPTETQTIRLADLPEPPETIKRWIDSGDLKISFGGRRPSQEGMAAETTFRMVHRYRSNPRWTMHQAGSNRICQIRFRFRLVQLRTTHEIWFLERPDTERFWSDPLVLHEFDHLRLSADPRLGDRFRKLVYQTSVIERSVENGETVDANWVEEQVDQYVQQQFNKVTDLASIRYRELDRLTDHGRRQIPADCEIAQTLTKIKP